MNETKIHAAWRTHGFVILPGYLSDTELAPAVNELDIVFPTGRWIPRRHGPRPESYRNDEFDGIRVFPFASTELSLLAVTPRLVGLAERLLLERDLRIYSAEAWAEYTGATNRDQDLHSDYLNHTVWCQQLRRTTSSWRCLSSSATFARSWAGAPGFAAAHRRATGKSQLLPSLRRAWSIRGRRRSC